MLFFVGLKEQSSITWKKGIETQGEKKKRFMS